MQIEGTWDDLKTRGFVVVRDFLPPDVLQATVADCQVPTGLTGPIAFPLFARLRPLVEELLPDVREKGGSQVNSVNAPGLYFRNKLEALHTDTVGYHMWQDFSRYVNFWIPVIKPRRDRSGLRLVPTDVLEAHDPRLAEMVRGRGSAVFMPRSVVEAGEQAIHDYWLGVTTRDYPPGTPQALALEWEGRMVGYVPEVDLYEISVAPEVAPGDAIIARADVFHGTQDAETDRVAISIRAFHDETVLRRSFYTDLSRTGRSHIALGPAGPMVAFLAAYEHHQREELTSREVYDFVVGFVRGQEPNVAAVHALRPRLKELLNVA